MSAALLETPTISNQAEATVVQVADPNGNPATAVRNDGTQASVDAMIDLAVAFHVRAEMTARGFIYLQLPGAQWPHRPAEGDWFVAGAAGVGVFRPIAFHRTFRRTA
ncbi:hypothetical protein LG293_16600 (plasmid) [Citricoccus nitrophenolicus]